jgi:hypothetical protein
MSSLVMVTADAFRLGNLDLPRVFAKARHAVVSGTLAIVPESRAVRQLCRIAALSNLRPAPESWTRSTDLPAGSEGSSRSGVIARRFKGRRRSLEILSVSQRRLAAYR